MQCKMLCTLRARVELTATWVLPVKEKPGTGALCSQGAIAVNGWKPPFHHSRWSIQNFGDLMISISYLLPFQLRPMRKAGAQNFWKSDSSSPIFCTCSNQYSHGFHWKEHSPLDLKLALSFSGHWLRAMDLCYITWTDGSRHMRWLFTSHPA